MLVNALVFLFELTLSPSELVGAFHVFGIVPARFTHADWAISAGLPLNGYWPFLTSMFLHGGWLHIIGNMWATVEYLPQQRRFEEATKPR